MARPRWRQSRRGNLSPRLRRQCGRAIRLHFSSVLWRCWFGDRKGIRPIKTSALKPFWMLSCRLKLVSPKCAAVTVSQSREDDQEKDEQTLRISLKRVWVTECDLSYILFINQLPTSFVLFLLYCSCCKASLFNDALQQLQYNRKSTKLVGSWFINKI